MTYLFSPLGLILCIFLGWGSRVIGIFSKEDYHVVSKLVMNITLPLLVLYQYQNFENRDSLLTLVAIGFITSFIPPLLTYLVTGRVILKNRAFMMLHVGGYNVGGFALPVILGLIGPQAAMAVIFFDVGNAIMMTGGSYALTTKLLKIETDDGIKFKGILLKFLKSPPFMMYIFVILLYILNIQIEQGLFEILRPVGQANGFLSTFMLGMLFEIPANKLGMNLVVKTLIIRWICFICFSIVIFFMYSQDIEIRKTIILLLASPIGTLSTIYTEKIDGDVQLSSFNTILSVFISIIVMVIIYIFL